FGGRYASHSVGARYQATEVMVVTPYIRDCIENKEKTKFIREQIAVGTSQYGMQTFDQSLFYLTKGGLITVEEALKRATNPDEFKLRLQGVQFTSDEALEQMEDNMGILGNEDDLMSDDNLFSTDDIERFG
ncbi:MAG: hypothetical protein AAFY88_11115, partial [Acidobacteriota bacterium]